MDEKKLDKTIDKLMERYQARDAEGVNRIWESLSEEDKKAFHARLEVRSEQMRVEAERMRATTDEMLRMTGQTREEFEAELAEADKGKISLFKTTSGDIRIKTKPAALSDMKPPK
ncbi:MAG: hypothetical protein ACJ74Q_21470 [Pyrinomonadaceae bacterium]